MFGELYLVPLGLYTTIGNILHALGEFTESKTLRMRIRDQIAKTDGISHPYNIRSISNIAQSHTFLGESIDALQLQAEALKLTESTKCSAVASTQYSIVVIYSNQGRWKEAGELGVQVVETSKRILGQEHLDTLASMNNLASTFSDQGR